MLNWQLLDYIYSYESHRIAVVYTNYINNGDSQLFNNFLSHTYKKILYL